MTESQEYYQRKKGDNVWLSKRREQLHASYLRNKEARILKKNRLLLDPDYAEKKRLERKKWYDKNKENRRRLSRVNFALRKTNDPGYAVGLKAKRLVIMYNMTLEQYNNMFISQNGLCKICNLPVSKGLAVDHDHKCCPGKKSCGKCVRGLICKKCNTALAVCGDNVGTIRNAIAYLQKWNDSKQS